MARAKSDRAAIRTAQDSRELLCSQIERRIQISAQYAQAHGSALAHLLRLAWEKRDEARGGLADVGESR
jgi:hypothetical protein